MRNVRKGGGQKNRLQQNANIYSIYSLYIQTVSLKHNTPETHLTRNAHQKKNSERTHHTHSHTHKHIHPCVGTGLILLMTTSLKRQPKWDLFQGSFCAQFGAPKMINMDLIELHGRASVRIARTKIIP